MVGVYRKVIYSIFAEHTFANSAVTEGLRTLHSHGLNQPFTLGDEVLLSYHTVRSMFRFVLCSRWNSGLFATMNIFSLSHLLELANELPDPKQFLSAERGRSSVIRLPLRDWDAVRDAQHPERQFEAHANAYVEFEIVHWRNTNGVTSPRWVLRGLVAM